MDEQRFGRQRRTRRQWRTRRQARRWGWWATAGVALLAVLPACDAWEQVGHGPGNTRFNPDETAITPATAGSLTEAWSVPTGGSLSEPILSGGHVYTTESDRPGDAAVRAHRADTGALVWSHRLPAGAHSGDHNPVVMVDGALWVSHVGRGAGLCSWQLTQLDPATGAVVATEAVGPGVMGPVVVEGTKVAFTTRGGCSQTGGQAQLVVRDTATPAASWSFRFDLPPGSAPGTPSMGGGRVVFAAEGTVHAFDTDGCGAATCAPRWTASLDLGELRVFADERPVVGPDGTVYLAGATQDVESLVQVFDGATGARLWRTREHAGPGAGWQRLALAEDRLYVADHRHDSPSGGAVEVFDAGGCGAPVCAPVWSAAVDGPPVAGLTVAGDVLHLGVFDWDDSRFVAYDARGCGAAVCPALGSVSFGDEQPGIAAVAGGRVAVTTPGSLRVLVPGR